MLYMPAKKKTEEIKEDVRKAGIKAKNTAKKAAADVKADEKKIAAKAKATAAKVEKDAKATTKKVTADVKETAEKVKKTVKAPAKKSATAKLNLVIQSRMGGSITAEEIAAKIPKNAENAYVKVEENKIYWTTADDAGSVDIW